MKPDLSKPVRFRESKIACRVLADDLRNASASIVVAFVPIGAERETCAQVSSDQLENFVPEDTSTESPDALKSKLRQLIDLAIAMKNLCRGDAINIDIEGRNFIIVLREELGDDVDWLFSVPTEVTN